MLFSDVPGALPHIRSGALRPLAVTTASRSAFLPDVPAVGETVAGYASSTWYGTGVPKGTPPEIVERLSREMVSETGDLVTEEIVEDNSNDEPAPERAFP